MPGCRSFEEEESDMDVAPIYVCAWLAKTYFLYTSSCSGLFIERWHQQLQRAEPLGHAGVPLNVIGFFAMPGVFLSLILTGSAHDPKLVLATFLNAVLYAALFAWWRAYRKRKLGQPKVA